MTRREPKAAEWLRQQIEELGALRNASVRDPQFKAWRQNTLTFIQRIWPGDTSKSERFRRVPFTPPSTKHDVRTGREYYERGCGEALEYLTSLLASLGEAEAVETKSEPERHPESFEGDFPEVDLGGGGSEPAGALPQAALDDSDFDFTNPPAARGQGPPGLPAAERPETPAASGDFLSSGAFLDPEADSPGKLPPSGVKSAAGAKSSPKPAPAAAEAPARPAGKPVPAAPATRAEAPPPSTGKASDRDAGVRPVAAPPAGSSSAPTRISVRSSITPPEDKHRANPLEDFFGPSETAKGKEEPKREEAATRHREDRAAKEPEAAAQAPPRAEKSRDEEASKETPRKESAPAPRSGKKKSKGPKPRLKDMLGLSSLEHDAAAHPERSAEAPTARDPITRGRENPATPEVPPVFVSGVESSGGWSLPEFFTPGEAPVARDSRTAGPDETEEESLSAAHVESLPASEEETEEAEAGADTEARAGDEDSGHAARVTAEFLQKSPVLSSLPRPVNRHNDATDPIDPSSELDSAASRLLALAAEVDRLGVPEGHRARARAALMDLARQLDEHEVAWDVLREAIHFVMEFPPLARRTLPLLLPFLDLAA